MSEQADIERIAEALWQSDSVRARGHRRYSDWNDESEELREQWRFQARAALAEIDRLRSKPQDWQAGFVAGKEAAAMAVRLASWRHLGDDEYSKGMGAGARHQVHTCIKAIRAISVPQEPT